LTAAGRSEKITLIRACREKSIYNFERKIMTKAIAIAVVAACLSFVAGIALAEKVHDWHDLDAVHHHVEEAIKEMDHARAANHYDMQGHGAKAEEHLHAAERELHEAIDTMRAEH
jgi:Spy/CpxP family protein refolding chaperone